jgi:hypothetical protein
MSRFLSFPGFKKIELKEKFNRGENSHTDFSENHMLISLLKNTVMNAQRLLGMIHSDDDLPEWCHSKITLAQDYIDTVTNYMESEVNEQAQVNEIFGFGKKKPPETATERLTRLINHANDRSEWANRKKDPDEERGWHGVAQHAHDAVIEEALKQENYELVQHHAKLARKHSKHVYVYASK